MFYLKLAINNIKNSIGIFTPFILSSLVLFMLICSTQLIMLSPVSETMQSGTMTLGLAITVLTIFAFIMATYSYNFLMKQRSREFGLYNMLGMNKKQVSVVASIELIITYILVVLIGSILSAVFSNLSYLFFIKLIQFDDLKFTLNPLAFILTAVLFLAIFGFLLIIEVLIISKSSPLILFRSQEKGEKEPKGNVFLALLGVISLGAGYGLSVTSHYIQSASLLLRFFTAVIFVIIGTYLFYISFISWYLKKRRANKAYFYQPEHFISTSQMLFRMKQNAVGLANITLLAIMSFVTIATTTSLYTDMIGKTDQIFPKSVKMVYRGQDMSAIKQAIDESFVTKLNQSLEDTISYKSSQLTVNAPTNQHWEITEENLANPDYPNVLYTYVVTQEDMRRLGNDLPQLADNQIIFYTPDNKSITDKLTYVGQDYELVSYSDNLYFPDLIQTFAGTVIVVSNDQVLEHFVSHTQDSQYEMTLFADVTPEVMQTLSAGQDGDIVLDTDEVSAYYMLRESYEHDVLGFVGGFLFTGFLLGISFLLGAALIIYYKQYSEGHEDKKSYKILQEVGMSAQAVKKTINSQTILVFFMPLVMAIVHFLFAIVMLRQMLLMFGVTSATTVYTVSAIVIVLVILIYYLIYRLTSRTYFKIIER
ncbi:FtsX-like permease family protein [Streptococcus fryi]